MSATLTCSKGSIRSLGSEPLRCFFSWGAIGFLPAIWPQALVLAGTLLASCRTSQLHPESFCPVVVSCSWSVPLLTKSELDSESPCFNDPVLTGSRGYQR